VLRVKPRRAEPRVEESAVSVPAPSSSSMATPPPAPSGSAAAAAPGDNALEKIAEGGAPPRLPEGSPERVRFGAILFTYQGAQYTSPDARTKQAARELASSMLDAAREDFHEAAKRGDPGSSANAGEMERGILEPHLEYLLFRLPPKTVFELPVDTPRGYLIVKVELRLFAKFSPRPTNRKAASSRRHGGRCASAPCVPRHAKTL
jgi:hypothetical protein